MRVALFAVAAVFAASPASLVEVRAEGAVALGVPRDVAKSGVSMGYSYNFGNTQDAEQRAIADCQRSGSATSKSLCKVASTFRNECYAASLDPVAGTPGWGWAITATRGEAERVAVADCRARAGDGRKDFCKVVSSNCDGTGR